MPYALGGMLNSAHAAVRVGNLSRSYADSYYQVEQQRAYAEYESNAQVARTAADLPLTVADAAIAQNVLSGNDDATMQSMEKCSRIYPDGEFAWASPTVGTNVGGRPTCVSVVEMRTRDTKTGSDVVLARANIAAGESIKCNISAFPADSYTSFAGQITFPADNAPTIEDVIQVMNQEQKQNAGLKIAAAAVVGALGGNITGKNDPGKDGLLGTDKQKMRNSAIGGVLGAGLMAASTYSGKVAGDVILSTGVNAVAGGVFGNMLGTGDSVLRIEKCKLPSGTESNCLWGVLITSGKTISKMNTDSKYTWFIDIENESVKKCATDTNGEYANCAADNLIHVKVNGCEKEVSQARTDKDKGKCLTNITDKYEFSDNKMTNSTNGKFVKVTDGNALGEHIPVAIADVNDKFFGIKSSDWYSKMKGSLAKSKIYKRGQSGTLSELESEKTENKEIAYSLDDFYPMTVDAEDGDIIDLGNRARMKSTMIGAGAGGALGGFTAYQGAQDEIQERWVTASQEYKDSLQKVYCLSGKRYWPYNDMITIPNMNN